MPTLDNPDSVKSSVPKNPIQFKPEMALREFLERYVLPLYAQALHEKRVKVRSELRAAVLAFR
jgi:hypothetical protein